MDELDKSARTLVFYLALQNPKVEQEEAKMAVEITGYLMFAKSNSSSLIFNRDIREIIALDEGHDRPSWAWVKSSEPRKNRSRAWVPERPATILRDGLMMAAVEGLSLEKSISPDLASRSSKVVDLNHTPLAESTYRDLVENLKGYEVCVLAFPGSSLVDQVQAFRDAGLNVTVLVEQS